VDGGFVILVADGSAHIRDFLMRELQSEGYGVQLASDHGELFAHLDKDPVADLVVLDLNLPFYGGMDVLVRLQNRTPPVPIVIHTIFTEYEHHSTVRAADAFVEKQGDPAALLQAIDMVLHNHYPQRFSFDSMVKNN
jgi:DNA-binding response OmpR family regulator